MFGLIGDKEREMEQKSPIISPESRQEMCNHVLDLVNRVFPYDVQPRVMMVTTHQTKWDTVNIVIGLEFQGRLEHVTQNSHPRRDRLLSRCMKTFYAMQGMMYGRFALLIPMGTLSRGFYDLDKDMKKTTKIVYKWASERGPVGEASYD